MMMNSQRARGIGHRAFYLHPEGNMGSGGLPSGTSDEDGEPNLEATPESAERKPGTAPESETPAPTEK